MIFQILMIITGQAGGFLSQDGAYSTSISLFTDFAFIILYFIISFLAHFHKWANIVLNPISHHFLWVYTAVQIQGYIILKVLQGHTHTTKNLSP